MLLEVASLTKRFGDVTVLNALSMTLNRGEVVALTGDSGSGKSTLLHVAAGLEPPDSGHVHIDGRDVFAMSDTERAELRRKDIGIVFQQFNLIPSLTVSQNLLFQAQLAQATPPNVDDLAEELGLSGHLNNYPEQLSGGQQQRVAIGRAIAAGPQLILADEPTGNLDEATGDAVFDLLLEQTRRSGAGLLIVTHSARIASRADRRLHLSQGRLS
ncbi:MAG: ABC transporter ATP-binding protein [Boseongicola sp.]|nr:ABC transporter ATP-binding protein [Boseongicola sp.]MDD9976694.1 ABC transporter ATP-binding protein [Boseongicola sp.]